MQSQLDIALTSQVSASNQLWYVLPPTSYESLGRKSGFFVQRSREFALQSSTMTTVQELLTMASSIMTHVEALKTGADDSVTRRLEAFSDAVGRSTKSALSCHEASVRSRLFSMRTSETFVSTFPPESHNSVASDIVTAQQGYEGAHRMIEDFITKDEIRYKLPGDRATQRKKEGQAAAAHISSAISETVTGIGKLEEDANGITNGRVAFSDTAGLEVGLKNAKEELQEMDRLVWKLRGVRDELSRMAG